ncbi:MAG: hypothetical protein INR71_08230 [Terriglobus roseus]|nr:hypothetical protein [Terriglobus roseus]
MTVASPWQWFCSTRTFSNSIEAALTVAAFYFWPWNAVDVSRPPSSASIRRGDVPGSRTRPAAKTTPFSRSGTHTYVSAVVFQSPLVSTFTFGPVLPAF